MYDGKEYAHTHFFMAYSKWIRWVLNQVWFEDNIGTAQYGASDI
jgi:hypothetical protein